MPFAKGKSGNPAGRKSGQTAGSQLKKAIVESMPGILNTLIEQALAGDTVAAKVLIDKVIPSIKPQAATVQLPVKKSLTDQGQVVISKTIKGDIPSDTGGSLMSMLAAQGKLIELNDLMARIELLESKQ